MKNIRLEVCLLVLIFFVPVCAVGVVYWNRYYRQIHDYDLNVLLKESQDCTEVRDELRKVCKDGVVSQSDYDIVMSVIRKERIKRYLAD